MRHKTRTTDDILELKGEIRAIRDTGETLLKASGVLVQRSTMHSWSVRGKGPCIVAAEPHP